MANLEDKLRSLLDQKLEIQQKEQELKDARYRLGDNVADVIQELAATIPGAVSINWRAVHRFVNKERNFMPKKAIRPMG